MERTLINNLERHKCTIINIMLLNTLIYYTLNCFLRIMKSISILILDTVFMICQILISVVCIYSVPLMHEFNENKIQNEPQNWNQILECLMMRFIEIFLLFPMEVTIKLHINVICIKYRILLSVHCTTLQGVLRFYKQIWLYSYVKFTRMKN